VVQSLNSQTKVINQSLSILAVTHVLSLVTHKQAWNKASAVVVVQSHVLGSIKVICTVEQSILLFIFRVL